jgi:type 1 glutamine amidotransferase
LSRPCSYERPTESQRIAWKKFVGSGRPVLSFHGGIASYDDWLDYGKLLGFRWLWGVTKHSNYGDWDMVAAADEHPVVASVPKRFTVKDEIYYNVQVEADIGANVWAWAEPGGLRCPLLMTGQGGRIDGAGRCAYFANGHSEETFDSKELRTLLVNTLSWLATP